MESLLFVQGHPGNSHKSRAHISSFTWFLRIKMAASFLNKLAAVGLGVAAIGGVVNTALYNGKIKCC